MKRLIIGLAAVLALSNPAPAADESVEEVSKMMATIAARSFSARESAEKRYAFILPALIERCSDIDKPMRAADMLVTSFNLLDERGFGEEEGLFQVSVNLHRLTVDVAVYAADSGALLKCAEIWGMYINTRQNGRTPTESMEAVAGIAKALYGLAK